MKKQDVKVYPYRWVVLGIFSLLLIHVLMVWVSLFPIVTKLEKFYGITSAEIGYLAMAGLLMALIFQIPAAYIVDTWGIRKGIGIGAIIVGAFGFARGFSGDNFTILFITTTGFSLCQAFIFNSMTIVSAKWFPVEQRSTIVGVMIVAVNLGILCGNFLSPILVVKYTIPGMLKIHGVLSLVISAAFLLLIRDNPPTPPAAFEIERVSVFKGLKHIFTQRDSFMFLVFMTFIIGLINAIMTWVEQMIAPRGFSSFDAGVFGAFISFGGILGCFLIPAYSDKHRIKKPVILFTTAALIPALLGVTFCNLYPLLMASGFLLGFFLTGTQSVQFQYNTELCYPAPEATSQGVVMTAGQIGGVIIIYFMETFRTESGAMTPSLIALSIIFALLLIPLSMIPETRLAEDAAGQARMTENPVDVPTS
jgi:MFS family permease